MSARIAAALALVLAAQPALADNAKQRGGSSGSSSSAGSRHPSPGVASSSASGSHSGGSPSSSSVDADRRHPRPGTGSFYHRHAYGSRYYRSPYYRSHSYGYYPYYDFGYFGGSYPYAPYYGYRRYSYRHSDAGAIRLQVEPDEARVFVDGYYAGIVDDFDGIFQSLNLAPGRHEIALRLEGYRTHRVRVYVPYGRTIKIHYHMVKGSGEDTVEDLGGERYSPAADARRDPEDRDRDGYDADDDPEDRDERPSARRGRDGAGAQLRLSVRPEDASVYVDGEFRGSGRQARSLDLPAGRHRLEVVRPGFRTFDREVEVRGDNPVDLDVDLERP